MTESIIVGLAALIGAFGTRLIDLLIERRRREDERQRERERRRDERLQERRAEVRRLVLSIHDIHARWESIGSQSNEEMIRDHEEMDRLVYELRLIAPPGVADVAADMAGPHSDPQPLLDAARSFLTTDESL